MKAATSSRYSTIARKYQHDSTRGLQGGKAGQRLGPALPKGSARVNKVNIPAPPKPRLKGYARLKAIPRCERKQGFDDWREAEAHAIRITELLRPARRIRPVLAFAYRCADCSKWHARLGRSR